MIGWRSRLKKTVAVLAAAAALCGLPAAAHAAPGWRASEDDMLLLQMRVGKYRLNGDLRGYQTDRGVCVDLADLIQILDLPVRLDKKSRRATGWLFSEDRTFTLDLESETIQTMNMKGPLRPDDVIDTPEGWCVDAGALSRWFGVTFRPDLFDSALVVESDRQLPFIEAIERRSRAARLGPRVEAFDLAKLPRTIAPYRGWRTPAVDVVARVGYDQGATLRQGMNVQYELFAAGEVAGASYDARLASDEKGAPKSLRVRAYRIDPDGGLLGPLKATQVTVGDVQGMSTSLSGRSQIGRGAFVSNRSLYRSTSFAQTILRGTLPAGWDAELYRNGQLLAFQTETSDGRYGFDVELLYGRNDLEVVLYGPQGQIRREKTVVPVGQNTLRPGEMQYWAEIMEANKPLLSFGRERFREESGLRWGVGVERGLDKRMSAGFSTQGLLLDGRRRHYVEGNIRRAIGPMLLELSGAQELGRGRAWRAEALGQIGRFSFQAQTLWVDGGFESDMVDANQKREHALRIDTSLRFGRMTMPFQIAAEQDVRTDGTRVNEFLIRSSVLASKLALTAELANKQTRGRGGGGADDGMRLRLLANTRLAGVPLRGETEFRLSGPDQGFVSASLTSQFDITDRSDLRVEGEYHAHPDRMVFGLGYVHRFERFSLQARGTYGTDGEVGAGLQLAFSFGPDPIGGGLRVSNEKLARTGQASVAVFLDEDGDGHWSPGERALPDVSVEAGYRAALKPTDASGRAVIEGLEPHRPVLIAIDEASLPDPFLKPARKGIVVTPRPGIATDVAIAVSPTGEVEGTIHGLEGAPLAGVDLELLDEGGVVAAAAMSEYDGFFLFQNVPYGRYRLKLAAGSATVLGARPELGPEPRPESGPESDGAIRVDSRQTVARLGIVRLRPVGQVAHAGP